MMFIHLFFKESKDLSLQDWGLICCGHYSFHIPIHRVKWRHSNLWSQYDLHVVGHAIVLCEVNW